MSACKNIIIFLGPPGSGKGTLAHMCVKRRGWAQLSTGNLCRQHIAEKTKIGQEIDFAIKSGKLISDSLIIQMVNTWLSSQIMHWEAVIFDGFPRTRVQAAALRELLVSPQLPKIQLWVIKMVIPDERIVARLAARSICQNNECQAVYSLHEGSPLKPKRNMTCDECASPLVRRSDDREEAIRERLLVYHKHEQDLIDFYDQIKQRIISLNVEQPLEQVYDNLISFMGFKRA